VDEDIRSDFLVGMIPKKAQVPKRTKKKGRKEQEMFMVYDPHSYREDRDVKRGAGLGSFDSLGNYFAK
jgi:hypothetical protein